MIKKKLNFRNNGTRRCREAIYTWRFGVNAFEIISSSKENLDRILDSTCSFESELLFSSLCSVRIRSRTRDISKKVNSSLLQNCSIQLINSTYHHHQPPLVLAPMASRVWWSPKLSILILSPMQEWRFLSLISI